ncbi:uncharacterized protein LMH87_008608 [Akanthomyces muscarius]|uniref:Ankyrin repeat protein n=1 Tax=Akanthomyces muscarius TaxID=2231603 RepID=A0A9W8UPT8_AKAMU|nr:uncharacterized protein LMH87_008608 [Akanthomyces muscarius]KAJ4158063.1 hypothetical protein LMH87_008608 [Akanthomyces muscarius]
MVHLPDELIIAIGKEVPAEHDLNTLAQTNRRFLSCIDPILYSRKTMDTTFCASLAELPTIAILRAVQQGGEDTLRKALRYNTDGLDQVLRFAVSRRFDRHLAILLSAYSVERYGTAMIEWAMFNAAFRGRTFALRTLLESGLIDPWRDELLSRLLCSSVSGNSPASTSYLLSIGDFDLDYVSGIGEAALGIAASRDFVEVTQLLLNTGRVDVEITSRTNLGFTPFLTAVYHGHEAIARALLATGLVDVNRATVHLPGQTALMLAAARGHAALVDMLLAQDGIEVDARDDDHRSALTFAASGGCEAVVEMLLATGKADIHARDRLGRTPLSQANSNGKFAIVCMMLDWQRNMADENACSTY